MLHDRLLQSDSDTTSFTAQYHQYDTRRRILSHHQFDNGQYVSRVTCTAPRYDVITPQCVYSQLPTSSSMRVCGRSDVMSVTADQWPYVAGHLQPTADWTSTPTAATFWGCRTRSLPDDCMSAYTTIPHSSSAMQFSAECSSIDGFMPGWRFDGDERLSAEMATTSSSSSSSALTPINSELNALTTSTQRTFSSEPHHQLNHISTLSRYPVCEVSSSSSSLRAGLTDDDSKHQFGTRPTPASTSIGTYICHKHHIYLSSSILCYKLQLYPRQDLRY